MDYKDNIILYVASSKHDEQMKLFTEDPVSILDDAFVHLFGSFLHLHLLNIVRKEAGKRQLYLCQSLLELYQSNPDLASFSLFSVTILTCKFKYLN